MRCRSERVSHFVSKRAEKSDFFESVVRQIEQQQSHENGISMCQFNDSILSNPCFCRARCSLCCKRSLLTRLSGVLAIAAASALTSHPPTARRRSILTRVPDLPFSSPVVASPSLPFLLLLLLLCSALLLRGLGELSRLSLQLRRCVAASRDPTRSQSAATSAGESN